MADRRVGVLAALIGNCHRDAKTHPRPLEPSDFFESLHEPKPPQTPEDQIVAIECWAAALA